MPTNTEVVWFSGASTCWTVTVSNRTRYRSAAVEAELHEAVNCAARELIIRHVLQAMELKAVVLVGTDSSAAAVVTPRLATGRVRHLEVKDLWIQQKVSTISQTDQVTSTECASE